MKLLQACLIILLCSLSIITQGRASERRSNMKSKLELAISTAVSEARKCNIKIDEVEMEVSIVGPTYQVRVINPLVRGGGALVIVDRETARVQKLTCLQ